jgi:hypothetical protein
LRKGATGRLAGRRDGLVVVFWPDNRSASVAAVLNSRRIRARQMLIVGSAARIAVQGSSRPRSEAEGTSRPPELSGFASVRTRSL